MSKETNLNIMLATVTIALWALSYWASLYACVSPGCGNGHWFAAVSVGSLLAAMFITGIAITVWFENASRR